MTPTGGYLLVAFGAVLGWALRSWWGAWQRPNASADRWLERRRARP